LVSKTNDYSFHVAYKVPFASTLAGGATRILEIGDGTTAERLMVGFTTTAGRLNLIKTSSLGSVTLDLSSLTWTAGDVLNIRGTVGADGMILKVNSGSADNTTSNAENGFATNMNRVAINTATVSLPTNPASGTVLGFQAWDRALSDAELAALSADAFRFPSGGRSLVNSVLTPVLKPALIPALTE
jgi:hypothetical protein